MTVALIATSGSVAGWPVYSYKRDWQHSKQIMPFFFIMAIIVILLLRCDLYLVVGNVPVIVKYEDIKK